MPFEFAWGLAESPDGRHLYLTALFGGLSSFVRNPDTGRLTLAGNLRLRGQGQSLPAAVESSPDGRFLYALRLGQQVDLDGPALLVFSRDGESGGLDLVGGCCEDVEMPEEPADFGFPSLAISADGRDLLATYFVEGKLARFSVNPQSGAVTLRELVGGGPPASSEFLGGSDVIAAPGGDRAYVVSNEADTLTTVTRFGTNRPLEVTEVLTDGTGETVTGLEFPSDLVATADGTSIISASFFDDAIGIQRRSRGGGPLSQRQVIDARGPEVFLGPSRLALSPDDRFLYVTRANTLSHHIYRRQPGTEEWVFSSDAPSVPLRDSVMSPDGRFFYAPAQTETGARGLGIFARDPESGRVDRTGLIRRFDAGDGEERELDPISTLAVSPDGRHLYVSAQRTSSWLLTFARDPETGELSLVQGLNPDEVIPDGFLTEPRAMALDPRGENLYLVTAGGLIVLERQAASGRLSYLERFRPSFEHPETFFLGTFRDLAVDPFGGSVYAVEDLEDTLAVFRRNRADGRLTLAERHRNGEGGVDGLLNPRALAVSPSGQNVFVTSSVGGILTFEKAPAPCAGVAESLCLNASRYELTVRWRARDGRTGSGTAVPGGTGDSGLVWFFNEDNWEMLVKVLDGCAVNGHVWVFSAATTNVEYTLTVRDTLTGAFKEYFNPLGTSAAAITDTRAFDSCGGAAASREPGRTSPAMGATGKASGASRADAPDGRGRSPRPSTERAAGGGGEGARLETCTGEVGGLCLVGDRFRVTVDWRRRSGERGTGRAVSLRSDDSGLFWFFNEGNWEMLIKVLDGCAINGNYWVFSAATTNVEHTLRVTDTATGQEKAYFNPLGAPAAAITDTSAFATCP